MITIYVIDNSMVYGIVNVVSTYDLNRAECFEGPTTSSIYLDVAKSEILDPTRPSSLPSAAIEVGGPGSSQIVGVAEFV